MKIAVLGAGNMGTTLANLLTKNKHEVVTWTIEKEVFESINKDNENKKYLSGIKLEKALIVTLNIEEAISEAEIILLAVPSHIVRVVAKQAAQFIKENQIIVDVAKGLEQNTNKLMSEVIREELPNNPIIAIGGPSIANELAAEIPTVVVFASEDDEALKTAQATFSAPYYKIYLSNDVKGVELGGAFKNIIALLAGICDGLGFGPNTKSALVTRGLAEISQLAVKLGAQPLTMTGLGGLGDLFVTSTSKHSRNRTLGEKIGKGLSLSDGQSEMTQVTEGVSATKIAKDLAKTHDLKLPLIEMIYSILFENRPPADAISEFMKEIPNKEF